MQLQELLRFSLFSILANRFRSGLTILGIVIGVAAIAIILTLGYSFNSKLINDLESFGSNYFAVFIGSFEKGSYDQYKFIKSDCRDIRNLCPSVRNIVQTSYLSAVVSNWKKKKVCNVIATEEDYYIIRNIKIIKGRFFNELDVKGFNQACIINESLANEMFNTNDPIGEKLFIGNTRINIIGVSASNQALVSQFQNDSLIYIPFTLSQQIFGMNDIHVLEGSSISKELVEKAAKQTIDVLNINHNSKDENAYQMLTMNQQKEVANQISKSAILVLISIAGLSLLVAGVGVMNMMIVSVTERTREIGICLSVGAEQKDILAQFLVESIVISLLGGIIGLAIGSIASVFISKYLGLPIIISFKLVAVIFVFTLGLGTFFGLQPAYSASKLQPIDTLRYE